MISGVYQIQNTVNGQRYIGSAARIEKRMATHMSELRRGIHCNPRLQFSWNKHGAASFEFKPLLVCAVDNLLMYEQRAIDGLAPEFNIAIYAGAPMRGRKSSPETRAKLSAAGKGRVLSTEERAKISAANRGRKRSPEALAKLSERMKGKQYHLGHKHTAEAKAKVSAANTGRKRSPEIVERLRIAMLGNKYSLGKTHSVDARAKMSAARTGKSIGLGRKLTNKHKQKISAGLLSFYQSPASLVTRTKISAASKGTHRSEECKARMSMANKGRVFSPEWKKNISEGRLRFFREKKLKS
jgi:group I intron endonuclease